MDCEIIFLDNDSTTEYYKIIEEAQTLNRSKKDQYYENHHIIPRSVGGGDSKENLVLLTAEEHFKVHKLLPFCVEGLQKNSLIMAWSMMSNRNGQPVNYEEYAYLKKEYGKIVSLRMQGMVGEKNNFFGRKHTPESKKLQSQAQLGKTQTLEAKLAISNFQTGRVRSTETRAKMSESQKGSNNPFYGKKHTLDDRKKISEARLGKKWIYNPQTMERKLINIGDVLPNGFIFGKGPNKNKGELNGN